MTTLTTKSLLVVDDEPGMRMALKTNFERAGWLVNVASGSTEALRKLEFQRFPLVITDVRMPDGDGIQLMRSLRASSPSTNAPKCPTPGSTIAWAATSCVGSVARLLSTPRDRNARSTEGKFPAP